MQELSASELLELWERGVDDAPIARGVLLAAVSSDIEPGDAAELAVGVRDARVLHFRERTFGTRVEGVASCPQCDEQLLLDFETTDLHAAPVEAASARMPIGDVVATLRAPTSADIVASLADAPDLDAARLCLLRRCVSDLDPDSATPDVVHAVVTRLAELDPQADVLLDVVCPGCRHGWQVLFDVTSFVWSEIDAWARRLLRDVHTLASSYGWSEAEVLALSPLRRHLYLEAVIA